MKRKVCNREPKEVESEQVGKEGAGLSSGFLAATKWEQERACVMTADGAGAQSGLWEAKK